ncbi:acetylornithine deacetylase/succinyl-diaminopimelate desuccinylase-like protein [Motilibacter rhizosphaerae]|uniref:Acetylornithine deacetylase/succinyl-diaminopimelate desuccinylase-like protein n=1 Tax=Motilibacter rhizosphaerae TaxID=598652 RepID=A0A4V2F2T8_9ACTN|nr:M20/M25/M40 family metallo-hydrolase [Motilibacter rhizosphaerae]RZS80044.1 acetylornithine deacetylase/succinyl-diaminopimelate desuccinylase-like protein [Motilibacter rhizosphaerae]
MDAVTPATADAARPTVDPADEVVALCSELIRIDTSNYGDGSGPGERKAAERVAELLAEVGLDPQIVESDPGRASVVARVEGTDPGRTDALLVHGHLDVVPAQADDWQVHPFSGEVQDGCVWGRGAVDMKDMDAMVLAVVRDRLRRNDRPARPLVLAFLADEEASGVRGAHFLADHHPELFEGCTEAISEVGGFSMTLGDKRFYAVETAEKGLAWMRLRVQGRAGHGSMIATDNAVTELCKAVARLGEHQWPIRMTKTVRTFLEILSEETGLPFDPEHPEQVLPHLGELARIVGATLRNTTNPTVLQAGYKANVIPQEAVAQVDGRFLPGYEDEFFATVDELLGPGVTRESVAHDIAVESEPSGPLWERMEAALLAEDPGARVLPYCLSGGTDAKSFAPLGIACYGFAPLRLPADLDFSGMFHGIDERVPVDGLQFGVRVLDRFLGSL